MASEITGDSPNQDKLLRINTYLPHPARVYDAWLGGKDNYAADREAAQAGLQAFPSTVKSVQANRAFLARAVEYLVAEAGIRQFLDIGTGLPSANNTHEVAQSIAPESRIVYVDNDPIVLAHAQALLTSSNPGVTDYIDADLRDPDLILREASRTLDFTRPVAVMLIAVLHFIPDDADPYAITDTLMKAVPPGSHLVVSHTAKDIFPEEMAVFERTMNENSTEKVTLRDREQVSGFFRGLDMLEPGVVKVSQWRPRSETEASAPAVLWGGMAGKPA
ncbi:SAM-dependent methyltransferase [Actinomadura sp. LD22]|uniref:SAM-dependent methyltransferase n=1 Tax=Actinomadura physcomitrii TaxID=2650748 RepID=A0A6I4MFE3_9ACTN|nr:SAM-dependent methyltransferase [Actinomadura physcomitrii]MWA04938.1 SAM-dependent methyltransferase [Actinomadura physcomitrii]